MLEKNFEKTKKFRIRFLVYLFIGLLIIAGVFYVKNIWENNLEEISNDAVTHATVSEINLNGEMLKQLRAIPEDVGTIPYESIKNRLLNLVKIDQDISFAYIYILRDGKIYFSVDSESVDSEDYSSPGQEYTEADSQMFQPFLTGEALITEPAADRWGNWVSVLVPMKDFNTGEIRAVFGVDYPADQWQKKALINTIQSGLVVFLFIFVLVFLLLMIRNNFKLKESKAVLRAIKKEQDAILDSIPAWVFYKDDQNRFIRVNKSFADVLKKSKEEIEGKSSFDLFPKEQADAYLKDDLEVINSGVPRMNIIESMQSPEGVLWVQTDKIPNRDASGKIVGVIGFTMDITSKKKAEDEIYSRNKELEKLNNLMIGREIEMINLKKELADLKNKK